MAAAPVVRLLCWILVSSAPDGAQRSHQYQEHGCTSSRRTDDRARVGRFLEPDALGAPRRHSSTSLHFLPQASGDRNRQRRRRIRHLPQPCPRSLDHPGQPPAGRASAMAWRVPWPLPPFCNRSMLGMYPRSGVVSGLAVSSPVKVSLAIDQRPPPTRVVAVAFMVRPAKSGSGGSAYVRLRLRRLPVANKLRVRTTPSRTCPAHVHLCLCPFAFPPYAPFPLIPRSVSSSSASRPSSYFSDGEGQNLESGADCDFDF
mmetsp:Transcript_25496/g.82381  ORF Transcript_25496/g.82381 Transcript_25496/m.82381 type:complete len:258 (-) Transcript_25496:411-1184(-)